MNRKKALQILEIQTTNPTETDIKKAYRKLSMKHHPDRNQGSAESAELFKDVNNAYSYLTNKNNEQQDEIIDNLFNGGMPNGPVNVNDIFQAMFSNSGFTDIINEANSAEGFNSNGVQFKVFHNGFPMNVPNISKPPPIIKEIEISFQQAYNGCSLPLNIERWIGKPGMNKETETIYVDIPYGIDHNEMIIIRDRGNIANEQLKGDIKVFIKIINDTPFKREGIDLILEKNISIKEALCGFSFNIDHLSGKSYTLRNSKVISPNSRTSINNLGLKRGNNVGKLDIIFIIDFPEDFTPEIKKKLEEILI